MSSEIRKILNLSFLALIIRLFFIKTGIGTVLVDMAAWTVWSEKLVTGSFGVFYSNIWCDYLPSYLYVLWILGNIKQVAAGWGVDMTDIVLFKIPAIVADVLTALVIYSLVKKYFGAKQAIVAFAIYAFNPAIIANSAFWGQVDGIEALLLVLVLWLFLEGKTYVGGIVLAILVLFKPTGLFMAPVAAIILINSVMQNGMKSKVFSMGDIFDKLRENAKLILAPFLIFLVTVYAIAAPFAGERSIPKFLWEQYRFSVNQYSAVSMNAFNFWELVGKPGQRDTAEFMGIQLMNWGLWVFLVVFCTCLFLHYKRMSRDTNNNFYYSVLASAVIFVAFFDLLTRVHERHLLVALPFLAILAVRDKKFMVVYMISSIVYTLNLYYAFRLITENSTGFFSIGLIGLLSMINIGILIYLFREMANLRTLNANAYEDERN